MKDFWYQVFSEGGTPSSKRVFGGMMIVAGFVCMIIFAVVDGATSEVKEMVNYNTTIGAALLGLSSICGVFSNGSKFSSNDKKEE